jgi:soluble lytic murein transglycosylase-like protein
MAGASTSSVQQQIAATAAAAGINPQLALAIANQESSYQQYNSSGGVLTGTSGEQGIYQLMPGTAAGLDVDPTDASENISGGISYLSQNLATFNGNTAQAVAAYNCGPTCVQNAIAQGGSNWLAYVPASTQSYVNSVLGSAAGAGPVSVVPVVSVAADSSGDDGSDLGIPDSGTPDSLPSWLLPAVAAAGAIGLAFVLAE